MTEKVSEYYLKVKLKKFEGKFAVLETEDKQKVNWPIKNLPDDIQEGIDIRLKVSTSKTDQEDRGKIARMVINNILGG